MINFVIPMAGRGKRFADAGYIDPKPFIEVNGTPMIIKVVDNLKVKYDHKFIFICLKEFIEKYGTKFKKLLSNTNFEIIELNSVTEGAACTVLAAQDTINTNEELIIANSDQLVLDCEFSQKSIDFYRKNKADGGILCFLNNSPKCSYVKINGEKIIQVAEKQVISDLATVGIYYYKTGRMFVEATNNMISNNVRVNGEFYVAPTYNEIINKNILPFMINEMVGLGTPDELNAALNKGIF